MDDSEEPDSEAKEEPKDEGCPVIPCFSAAGFVSLCSYDGISNVPDGAAAARDEDTPCSAEDESAIHRDVASGGSAEEMPATAGLPDDGAPVKVKRSWLTRIRKFFCRAIRTIVQTEEVNFWTINYQWIKIIITSLHLVRALKILL